MHQQIRQDQRVVISGLGLFTPLGRSVDAVCDAVLAGRSAIAPSQNIDQTELPCLCAEFRHDDTLGLPAALTDRLDRGAWFALKALDEALASAGLAPSGLDRARTAVVVGTSHSGIQHAEKILYAAAHGQLEDITPNDFFAALTDHVATAVCARLALTGIKVTISSACSSSNTAIGYGRDLLLSGQAKRVIVIGSDTLSPTIAAGFNSLKVMGKAPAAPFSNPSGISLGEGAGVLILENLAGLDAPGRSGLHRGEVLGYALSSDAFHPTSVDDSGAGIEAAISHALASAGITAGDVDYISAHGTGTDSNDLPESIAVARLFGAGARIASVKSSVGHTLGASGVVEAIISLVCAERGYYAPNNHFTEVRAGCATLDYVHGPQTPVPINTILCNNYGFGGNNSATVLSRAAGRFSRRPLALRPVFVSAYASCSGEDADKSSARRSSPSIQFALQAMETAIDGFGLRQLMAEQRHETGLVAGLLHGAQKAVEKYMFAVYQDGLRYARSMLFPLTTLNAAAGEVSIRFGIKGFNTTLCGPVGAMKFAYDCVRLGHQERMFDFSSDELTPLVLDLCARFGVLAEAGDARSGPGFALRDGAGVTLLESGAGVVARGGRALAAVLALRVAQEGIGHRLRGDGAALAALGAAALAECGLAAPDIDLVIGVGQGPQAFLDNERHALAALFKTPPRLTSVAMQLGYAPTAIFPQMVNLGAAILSGAAWHVADRSHAVWRAGAVQPAAGVARILVLFTSVTFEHCALVLERVSAHD